jgi:long-chain fatty acid transport protein
MWKSQASVSNPGTSGKTMARPLMAGSGMAVPQDALTALHWNPAAIVALPGQSIDVGLQLMMPSGTISSTVQNGAFGPIGPQATLNGATDSDAGPFPIPSIGYIYHPDDKPYSFGLSAFGVGGFGVDYALSSANPILTPQMPDGGMGFGAMSSTFMLMQISPTFAYQINEYVSIGVAPTLSLASLELSVFPATQPMVVGLMPDGSPLAYYPDAPASWATGYGAQAGIHVNASDQVSIGASFKSKQYFNDFKFDPEMAGADDFLFRLDYPMILSSGIGYHPLDRLLIAGDIRFIDFENTEGFSETGFDETGAVRGFGWESIFVASLGAQYQVNDMVTVRGGYGWNQNPISDATAFYNSPAPALITNRISAGATVQATKSLAISFAGQYGLSNEITGEWKNPMFPGGSNPLTSVTHEMSTFTIITGFHIAM